MTDSNVRTAFTKEAPTAGANAHTISGKENPSEHKRKRENSGQISIGEGSNLTSGVINIVLDEPPSWGLTLAF